MFFHPLSSYPGPNIAAASQIPCAFHTLRGRLPQWVKQLHDQYDSDVVRVSPRELSFINASAWKDIHGTRSDRLSFEKDPAVYGLPPNGTASLVTAKRSDHARMRRVLSHAFSIRALHDHEPIVESYVDLLIKRLHEQIAGEQRGKVDISMWFRWLAFDIAGDLSFGESFDCLQKQQLHAWANMIAPFLKADICLAACDRFGIWRHVLTYLVIPTRIKSMMKDHFAASIEKVSRRVKLGASRADFISASLQHNNEEGKGLTAGELQSNASLFIVAGSDTSATVLTGTIYYLLHNPRVLEILTDEIRNAFKDEKEITAESVSHLPYMLACIDETHRIYPVILTGQAVIVPPGGDMVGNNWLPAGVWFAPAFFLIRVACREQQTLYSDGVLTSGLFADRFVDQHVRRIPLREKLP